MVLQWIYANPTRIHLQCMDFNIRSPNTNPWLFFCRKFNNQRGLAILTEISQYYPLVINDFKAFRWSGNITGLHAYLSQSPYESYNKDFCDLFPYPYNVFFFCLFLGWEEKRRCSQVNTMSHVWNRCFWRRCSQTQAIWLERHGRS